MNYPIFIQSETDPRSQGSTEDREGVIPEVQVLSHYCQIVRQDCRMFGYQILNDVRGEQFGHVSLRCQLTTLLRADYKKL